LHRKGSVIASAAKQSRFEYLNFDDWNLSFDFAQDGEQFGPELTAEGLVEPFRIYGLAIS
jgi:hypothetical protein